MCQESTSMFAHFSSLFIVRPYVICGAPLGRLERTQEDSIFLGNRLKLIRETCPAQRNCRRVRYDLIGRRSSLFCRSALEILWILVCFLVTRHMALMHREWKQLSSCTRASVKHQDSEPYSRIVNTYHLVHERFGSYGDDQGAENIFTESSKGIASFFNPCADIKCVSAVTGDNTAKIQKLKHNWEVNFISKINIG